MVNVASLSDKLIRVRPVNFSAELMNFAASSTYASASNSILLLRKSRTAMVFPSGVMAIVAG